MNGWELHFVKEGNRLTKHITNIKTFERVFGVKFDDFRDELLSIYFTLDLVKFDDYLMKTYPDDYEIGADSMESFIERKFGKEAVDLVQKLF